MWIRFCTASSGWCESVVRRWNKQEHAGATPFGSTDTSGHEGETAWSGDWKQINGERTKHHTIQSLRHIPSDEVQ
jgi:hypothetical protein